MVKLLIIMSAVLTGLLLVVVMIGLVIFFDFGFPSVLLLAACLCLVLHAVDSVRLMS